MFKFIPFFFVSALRMAALLSCFCCHFSFFLLTRSVLDPVFASNVCFNLIPARLCLFAAHYILLAVAVKKQILSISQITDIEQYFAHVFYARNRN